MQTLATFMENSNMDLALRPSRIRIDVRPTKAKAMTFPAPVQRSSGLRKLPAVADVPHRVLLVAGDTVHTQLVQMILINNDMRVSLAQNAEEATRGISVELPHIILLDWEVDGID